MTLEHQPGDVLDNKYRIHRVLGRGGMGAVFEVEHLVTKHRRALKTLHPHLRERPEVVGRFLREASAAGRIGNPHIIETFDAGELSSGEPFLVMEFLQGQTLGERVEAVGRLPLDEVLDVMIQAIEGVVAAHQAGVVHRDLKPDNLYLTEVGGRRFVKLLDFGISKFDAMTGEKGMTTEGSMLGTPYYMAPEQISGRASEVDARTDVYALGVILYELITGTKPYDGATVMELAVKVHAGGAPPLSTMAPVVPIALSEIVELAMATDKARRPTARQLADKLSALRIDDAPTAVDPPATLMHSARSSPPTGLDATVGALSVTPTLTSSASSPDAPSTPRTSRSVLVLGVAGVVVIAGAALGFAATRGPSGGPTRPDALPSVRAADPAPAAAPIVDVSPATATASPSATASVRPPEPSSRAAVSKAAVPTDKPAPADKPAAPADKPAPAAPTTTTRSDKAGMATSPY